MALPDIMSLIRHDPYAHLALRACAGEAGAGLPDVESLWRKPVFTVESGGVPVAKKLSLESILDRFRSYRLVDDGGGPQPVDAVFPALLILTQEALPGAGTLAQFLRDRITKRFGDLIDDETGITINIVASPTLDHPVVIYLGYGIHAPEGTPRGRIEIRDADGDALGEPLVGETVAAGIYPGQAMVAFSRSERLTAAVHPDLPADAIFCLGRFPAAEAADGPGANPLPPLTVRASGAGNTTGALEVTPAAIPADQSVDVRYHVSGVRAQQGRVRLATIDVSLDTRPSKLRSQPPSAPLYLTVLGVVVRSSYGGRTVRRFWIDLTSTGQLRSSSLLSTHLSLVAEGNRLRPYERGGMRYLSAGAAGAVMSRVTFGRERRSIVATDSQPFGYVAVPPAPVPVIAGRGAADGSVFALDWLGEAITVAFADGSLFRLDQVMDRLPLGNLGLERGQLVLEPGPDVWLLDNGKTQAATRQVISPGQRLVLGPLVVELTAAGGGQ